MVHLQAEEAAVGWVNSSHVSALVILCLKSIFGKPLPAVSHSVIQSVPAPLTPELRSGLGSVRQLRDVL